MPDSASETEIISASPEHCFAVAIDVERYPEWAHDVKEAVIRERDANSRPTLVDYRVAALGRSTNYTLEYNYSLAPKSISWHLVQGDIERAIDGETGLIVNNPNRVDDVIAALQRLLGDSGERQRMGQASRLRAQSEFDYDKLAVTLGRTLGVF